MSQTSSSSADNEVPVWEKREQDKKLKEQSTDLPFGLYLLFSSFVAIAAVRSLFYFCALRSSSEHKLVWHSCPPVQSAMFPTAQCRWYTHLH